MAAAATAHNFEYTARHGLFCGQEVLEEETNVEACCCCRGIGEVEGVGVCPLCDGTGGFDPEGFQAGLLAVARAVADAGSDGNFAETTAHRTMIVELPGTGQGLIAVEPFAPGELILAEVPLITVPGTEAIRDRVQAQLDSGTEAGGVSSLRPVNEAFAEDARLLAAVASQVEQLDASAKEELLCLDDSFTHGAELRPGVWVELVGKGLGETSGRSGYVVGSEVVDGHESFVVSIAGKHHCGLPQHCLRTLSEGSIGGIFLTNAVDGCGGQDISHVYSTSSRINHSCRPNAVVTELQGHRRCVLALHQIEVGDEITISYLEDYGARRHADLRAEIAQAAKHTGLDVDALLVGLHRQKLSAKWGFWCQCPRCGPCTAEADAAVLRWEEI